MAEDLLWREQLAVGHYELELSAENRPPEPSGVPKPPREVLLTKKDTLDPDECCESRFNEGELDILHKYFAQHVHEKPNAPANNFRDWLKPQYLRGVDFWWVARHGWLIWLTGVLILLAMFYFVDRRNYVRAPKPVREELTGHEHWRIDGWINVLFLAVILGAVFINRPPFLREILMAAAAVGSYYTTQRSVHEANHFTLHPIKEVAILSVVLCVGSYLAFIVLLKLQFPVWPAFISG